MKKKILSVVLSLSILMSMFSVALAANEDYTAYTEVDPRSIVTVIQNKIDFAGIKANDDTFVYKNFGVDYFDESFTHVFSANLSNASVQTDSLILYQLSNLIAGYKDIDTANGNCVVVKALDSDTDNKFEISLTTMNIGSPVSTTEFDLTPGYYYFKVEYFTDIGTYGSYNLTISDDNFLTTLDNKSVSVVSSVKMYQYLFGLSSYSGTNTHAYTGYLENLNLSPISIPVVDTLEGYEILEYNDILDNWTAYVSGNVTSLGNDNCTLGINYQVKNSDNWAYVNVSEFDNNISIYQWDLYPLEIGVTYEYEFVIENIAGIGYGGIEEFIVDFTDEVPIIHTLSYPRTLDVDNLWANLYGEVISDGGSNVTGRIIWAASGENWTSSANTTDLVTNDTFSANVTGLEMYQTYYYYAEGTNDVGTNQGAIGYFTFFEVEEPEVSILPVTEISSTGAILNAYIDYDGYYYPVEGEACRVYFEYKNSSLSNWTRISGDTGNTDNTVSKYVGGLTPNTQYDVRAQGIAWNLDNVAFTGNFSSTLTFMTLTSYSAPIAHTGNVTFVSNNVVSVNGSILDDSDLVCSIWMRIKKETDITWTESLRDYIKFAGDFISKTFSVPDNNVNYNYQCLVENSIAIGYGAIETFYMTTTEVITSDDTGGTSGTVISIVDIVSDVRISLGLTGAFGTWAFMFILIIVTSLVFGIPYAVTSNQSGKTALGVCWLLAVISIVGGFIFTGQLGIWPIVILVGALVLFVMIIFSVKLSGGGQNG
jgi:hypothetical protein